ncbi:MAG: copper amine oxidase N-terminal domain-containing protein [Bacillota bacterium]|nr:copper amine oxidase N-terminal domain-containing protein [Bacillota bacterium]
MEKRLIYIIFILSIVLNIPYHSQVKAENIVISAAEIKLNCNEPPKKINGVWYLPFRPVMEALGWELCWDPTRKAIKGKRNDEKLEIEIEKTIITLNDKKLSLDVPPIIINSKAYIQSKFIVEQFGKKVRLGSKKNQIIVSDNISGNINVSGEGNIVVAGNGIILNIVEPYSIETICDMVEDADRLLGINYPSDAITKYEDILDNISKNDMPETYAHIMNNMGNAYNILSTISNRKENILKAISFYEEAGKEYIKNNNIDDDSIVLYNLATARSILAETTGDLSQIKQAIDEYEEASKVFQARKNDMNYTLTQYNLAKAYSNIGDRDKGLQCLLISEKFYSAVADEDTIDKDQNYYAYIHNSFGNIYRFGWEFTKDDNYLKKSEREYEAALKTWTSESFPLEFARVQKNLGDVYQSMPADEKKENIESNLSIALGFYNEALKIYTLNKFPLDYADIKYEQGNTYVSQYKVKSNAELINEALKCYNEALRVYKAGEYPLNFKCVSEKIKIAEDLR